ncbi:MAG: hypothetical protein HY038_07525 [Nitrospirae bacterium]|nr:hypothetical protein [Nitrospirota bacterium]
MGLHVFSVVAMTVALMVTGCGNQSLVRPPAQADLPAGDRSILAGEWEYEDGAAVILQLDEQGNGTYPFKEGRFETLQFGEHTWVGKWYQKENDREGGFVVKLSVDYTEGEGTWWYDRIGADLGPSEKGGTFHLSRKISHANLSDTPPAP